jgi:NADH:ubiquinone oxidoreductase subunit K
MAILKFIFAQSNILILLLSLELITLAVILFLFAATLSSRLARNVFFRIFTLAVCEARLGLRLLIKSARSSGKTYLNYFILKLNKLITFKVINTLALLSIIIIVNFQLKDL